MSAQLNLFPQGITQAHVDELLQLLRVHGWLTRAKLKQLTGWAERTIRGVAEHAGAEVVRGPRGFNAFEKCSLDEVEHCAAIAESQGTKMIAYGQALRKRGHQRLGKTVCNYDVRVVIDPDGTHKWEEA